MKETEQKLKGPLFIIFSSLFFSSYGIWSKLMSGFFGEFSQAWIRGLIITFILLVLGIVGKKFTRIAKEDWPWFIVTALAGGLNQAPYYYAFEKLELGTATMLFYASLTIGGFFFGKIFFKEKMTSSKIIALILAISGMGLIYGIKISGGFLPLLMAIVAGGMGSAEVVFSKKISHKYSTLQVIVLTFIMMFLGNLAISFFFKKPMPALVLNQAWLGQVGYTLSMLGAMYAVVIGFRYLEPSIGTLLGLLEIIFATLFGVIFFGESLSPIIIAGGSLILLAGALPKIFTKNET